MLNKLNDVLLLFSAERRELAALEIAELLGRPRSSVYRLLAAISEAGFLDQDAGTGSYRLGMHLASLGQLAAMSTSLQRTALPVLQRLADSTDETADLTVLVGTQSVTVGVAESYQPLMIPGLLGGHVPLHATAAGKVLLAWSGEERARELLRPQLTKFTDNTVVDIERLIAQLPAIRDRGYATADSEWYDNLMAVAAPVWNYRGQLEAAIALGWPKPRTAGRRDFLIGMVQEAALELSRTLGHSSSGRRAAGPAPSTAAAGRG